MTNLKLKRLSEFIDDMIQKYQIEETKNIKKSLRRKFVTELEAMGQWDKANSKTFGRNRTKVFNYEILDRLEKRCERYLVKKSGFDFDKFKDYKSNIDSENYFEEATEELKSREGLELLPDGEYRLNRKIKGFGEVNGRATVKRGVFTLLKGSLCADVTTDVVPAIYDKAIIEDNILQVDLVCSSPSTAGFVVIGKANNGWVEWKDANGNKIDIYRKK